MVNVARFQMLVNVQVHETYLYTYMRACVRACIRGTVPDFEKLKLDVKPVISYKNYNLQVLFQVLTNTILQNLTCGRQLFISSTLVSVNKK